MLMCFKIDYLFKYESNFVRLLFFQTNTHIQKCVGNIMPEVFIHISSSLSYMFGWGTFSSFALFYL